MDEHRRPQYCLLEEVASGLAMGKFAQACLSIGRGRTSLVWQWSQQDLAKITGKVVGKAAMQGDPFALEVVRRGVRALAEAIRQMLTLLAPRRVVIGGGVSLLGEALLFQPLRDGVAEQVFAPFAGCYDIVPAALGEEVVVHGALALARQRWTG